jgi:hypothetical protein
MYLSGTQYDFASRLHQLPLMSLPFGANQFTSGTNDMNNFIVEGRSYIVRGTVTAQESGKWEREIRNNMSMLSGNGSAMLVQYL